MIENVCVDALTAVWPFCVVMLDPRSIDVVELAAAEHDEVVEAYPRERGEKCSTRALTLGACAGLELASPNLGD